jgi:hypothetical protein
MRSKSVISEMQLQLKQEALFLTYCTLIVLCQQWALHNTQSVTFWMCTHKADSV